MRDKATKLCGFFFIVITMPSDSRKQKMECTPIEENGEVIGVELRIIFAEYPPLSKSKKSYTDFSTWGATKVKLDDELSVEHSLNINIYHPV